MIPSMSLESESGSAGPGPASAGPASAGPGGGPARSGQRFRLLDDPVVIRALAHPLRLELMSITGRAGQITTADAARELGISHGLASHHLRQLAKYGFVEQAAGKDNRERPWRLTYTSTSWRGADATPEGASAVAVAEEVVAERALANFRGWLQRRGNWPTAWRQHSGVGRSTVYLTLPELAELDEAIESLIRPYIDERPLDDVASRPEGSVPVDFTLFTIPLAERPEGDLYARHLAGAGGSAGSAARALGRAYLPDRRLDPPDRPALPGLRADRLYGRVGAGHDGVLRAPGAARPGRGRLRRPLGPQADHDRRRPAAGRRATAATAGAGRWTRLDRFRRAVVGGRRPAVLLPCRAGDAAAAGA